MDRAPRTFIDLKDMFALIRRQSRLMYLSVAFVVGGTLIYLFVADPLYTATTLVFVDPAHKNLMNPDDGFGAQSSVENARVESEVEILKSDTVALATVQQMKLLEDPEFGPRVGLAEKLRRVLGLAPAQPKPGSVLLNETLERLVAATSIRRRGLTYLVAVSVSSRSADKAALLANTMAQTYIDLQIRSKVGASLLSRDILQGQIANARTGLAETEDALDGYIEANIARLAHESGGAAIAIARSQLIRANSSHQRAGDRLSQARQALLDQNWALLATGLADEAVAAMAQQRSLLERRLGQLPEGSPDAIDLRSRLTELSSELSRRAEVAVDVLGGSVEKYENDARQSRAQLRQAVLSGSLSTATLAQIYELQQEADIAQRQYGTLLSRLRDIETQALIQVADSRIVSSALSPSRPSFPDRKVIFGLAAIAAIGLGTALAILNEYFIGGVTSPHQLANILPAKMATSIPWSKPQGSQFSVADAVVDAPLSLYAESLRRLRASVDLGTSDLQGGCKVILVTSSIPEEGKTSLAIGLARTYALAGRQTLLIDADLRKPSVHTYLGLAPNQGFLDFLKDPKAMGASSDFYDADPKSDVGVVLGSARSDMPTDQLLQSGIFAALIKDARASMDVVIIDTPPLIPVVDARYIAPFADAVVHCVRLGVTGQSDLRLAYDQLVDCIRPQTSVYSVLTMDQAKPTAARYGGYYLDYATN